MVRTVSAESVPIAVPDVLPDALVAAFRRDGYVVVTGLLTAAELQRYGPAVDAAVAARKAHDSRAVADKTRYEQSFIQCMNLWEDHPVVRDLTFHARIGQAAAALLGVDAIRLWHDQALYKEAGGRATDCHQDQPYWPMAETRTVTAWIPLDGSTIASGAMAYVPGSHIVGLRHYVHIFGDLDPPSLLDHPALGGVQPVTVEVPAGSVAFHHGLTVHLAHPNTTDRPRRVHTMIYFADGATRTGSHGHFSVDRDAIAVDAPIDGLVTPIVWPRSATDPIVIPPAPPAIPFPNFRGALPSA